MAHQRTTGTAFTLQKCADLCHNTLALKQYNILFSDQNPAIGCRLRRVHVLSLASSADSRPPGQTLRGLITLFYFDREHTGAGFTVMISSQIS